MIRLLAALIVLTAAACSAPKKITEKGPVSSAGPYPKTLPAQLMPGDSAFAEVESAYIRGISEFELENYEKALDILLTVYVKVPQFAGVNYALADCYLKMNDLDNATFYGAEAVRIEPQNKYYRLKQAEIYGARGNIDGAVDQLKKALTHHPRDMDILFTLASAYGAQNKLADANAVLATILKIAGDDVQLRARRFANFKELGQKDSAMAELKRMQKLEPENTGTLQTLARFQLENNDRKSARVTLRQVLKIEPGNTAARIGLADLFIQESRWDSAGSVLQAVITDSLVPAQNKLEIIQFLYSRLEKDSKNVNLTAATRSLLETFLKTEPEFAMGYAMAADFYILTGRTREALDALEKTTKLMPQNDNAWRSRVQSLYQMEQFDEAIRVGREADGIFPDDAFIHFIIGSSYFLKGSRSDALVWLKSAAATPARDEFRSVIWGTIGDVHAATDEWARADSAYEKALGFNPENDNVLNNYAYYLSERDIQLEKAEKMALAAIKKSPGNASYLDTIGWVYYKLKNYKKALEYIQQAVNTGDASGTVLEHMGDCYDKLGKKEEARTWWRKALEKDPSKKHLQSRI